MIFKLRFPEQLQQITGVIFYFKIPFKIVIVFSADNASLIHQSSFELLQQPSSVAGTSTPAKTLQYDKFPSQGYQKISQPESALHPVAENQYFPDDFYNYQPVDEESVPSFQAVTQHDPYFSPQSNAPLYHQSSFEQPQPVFHSPDSFPQPYSVAPYQPFEPPVDQYSPFSQQPFVESLPPDVAQYPQPFQEPASDFNIQPSPYNSTYPAESHIDTIDLNTPGNKDAVYDVRLAPNNVDLEQSQQPGPSSSSASSARRIKKRGDTQQPRTTQGATLLQQMNQSSQQHLARYKRTHPESDFFSNPSTPESRSSSSQVCIYCFF